MCANRICVKTSWVIDHDLDFVGAGRMWLVGVTPREILPLRRQFLVTFSFDLAAWSCSYLLMTVRDYYRMWIKTNCAEIPLVYVLMPWQRHQPSRSPPAHALKSFSYGSWTHVKWSRGSVNMEVWFTANRERNPHPWHLQYWRQSPPWLNDGPIALVSKLHVYCLLGY